MKSDEVNIKILVYLTFLKIRNETGVYIYKFEEAEKQMKLQHWLIIFLDPKGLVYEIWHLTRKISPPQIHNLKQTVADNISKLWIQKADKSLMY